jgi:NADH:ubiquinone oxidoreductase subunit H
VQRIFVALSSLAIFLGTPAARAAGAPFKVTAVHPQRIEVGTVLEIHGRGFTAEGSAPTVRLQGFLANEKGIRPLELVVRGVYESPRLIVYRFTQADFEKLGGVRGDFRGLAQVTCPLPGGTMATVEHPLRASLFPRNLKALGDAVVQSGAVPTVNWVLAVVILLLVWLALYLGAARLILFGKNRPPRPTATDEFLRWRSRRRAGWAGVTLLALAIGAGLVFLGRPLHDLLGRVAAIPYVVHLGLALLVAIVMVTVALLYAGPVTWVERRVAARMQSRVGPNRVGPQGIIQWLADGLKGVQKEDIIPAQTDPRLFRMAPYITFSPIFATFAVLPFSATWAATDVNVGILFVLSITSIVVPGLLMAGWASNNKWSLFGGIRAAAQIVSYEIPASLAVLSVVIYTGSLSMQELVRTQGGAPWNWYVFQNPFTFIAFFLFFSSALAEGNRAPFDLPEAESELVSGYNTEYSGMRFLLFFVGEYVNIYVLSAIATTVFLGGWRVPLLSVAAQEASIFWQLVGLALFWAKVSVLSFVVVWLRWTLPRLRVDQLMSTCWKYFVPITLVGFVGSALWYLVFADLAVVDKALRVVFFLMGSALAGYLLYRSWWHFKHTKAQLFVNPWL